MKKLLYLVSSLLMVGLYISYMFINIKDMGQGSPGLVLLGLSTIMGFVIISVQIVLSKKVYVYKSFIILILFFIYFIFRIVIDTQNTEMLKALSISTNGGIILYYIFGMMIGIFHRTITEYIISSKQFEKIFIFLFFMSIMVFSFFFILIVIDSLHNIRTDIFLLSSDDGLNYQRIGQFIIISFIILSFYFQLLFTKLIKRNFISSLMLFGLSSIYVFMLLLSMLFSQLVGSNNTLINLLIISISFSIMIVFLTKNNIKMLSVYTINYRNMFFGKLTRILYIKILLGLFLLFIGLYLLILYFDIDIFKFRIFGFGTEGMTSVNSRLELWNNFSIQLEYSLLLGNMGVDTYTTGTGSYVHSFIASLLTHLGLIGVLLFFTYLYFAIKEKIHSNYLDCNGRFIDNAMTIYSILIFVGFLLIAFAGVFFTWTPIWFLMGMIFNPFRLKEKRILN